MSASPLATHGAIDHFEDARGRDLPFSRPRPAGAPCRLGGCRHQQSRRGGPREDRGRDPAQCTDQAASEDLMSESRAGLGDDSGRDRSRTMECEETRAAAAAARSGQTEHRLPHEALADSWPIALLPQRAVLRHRRRGLCRRTSCCHARSRPRTARLRDNRRRSRTWRRCHRTRRRRRQPLRRR